uniref:legumain n=1 Tax=Ascaris suum TaxID=6253 RepID=F1L5J4_ASCSU
MPSLQLYSVFLISLIVRIEARLIRNRFHNRFRTWVQIDQQQHRHQHIWALLVAGSNTWQNYRHQADVCHAYHILRNHGVPEQRIITMMYDDIANNSQNRYPGKIFNRPNGMDVYEGVKIDYKGHNVTKSNFLAILEGNKTGVTGGNGRVIESTSEDHIFVYFSDHGGYGLIGFPFETLSVVDLNNTLIRMHRAKHFKHLVFYMEACESGSMFESLPDNVDIYANTAANALESSFACYCDNGMGLPCLGDEFSVNWMEDSDTEDLRSETLQRQYETVRDKTQLSDVMQYGNLSIADAVVGAFQGWRRSPRQIIYDNKELDGVMWPVREIPLLSLERVLDTEVTSNGKEAIQRKIQRLLKKRDYLDSFVEALVDDLIPNRVIRERVLNDHPDLLTQPLCFDTVVKMFSRVCFDFSRNPYALKFSYVLANLCEELIDTTLIVNRMVDICEEVEITGVH